MWKIKGQIRDRPIEVLRKIKGRYMTSFTVSLIRNTKCIQLNNQISELTGASLCFEGKYRRRVSNLSTSPVCGWMLLSKTLFCFYENILGTALCTAGGPSLPACTVQLCCLAGSGATDCRVLNQPWENWTVCLRRPGLPGCTRLFVGENAMGTMAKFP